MVVHPSGRPVAGADCYRSVSDVPGRLDGVIVMVPAATAAKVVADCIDAGK